MKNISVENIIKLMSMPKIGRKTALKLIQEITFNISNDNDLIDFINEKGSSFRLPQYTKTEFETGFREADEILLHSEKSGIKIISFQDSLYPTQLRAISDFPITLNYIGDISSLTNLPCVAVIGTREPTEFGYKIGVRLGEYFASNGFNIVSGLAIGCDTAGHTGAIKINGISTAVLAHGLDTIYPKENRKLADEILEKGGVIVSEYFVKQKPLANFFVERDRIQAGLSLGVIVVETAVKGGTMHTVKFCLENNRILAAINHPSEYLKEIKTQGNQLLIREGKALPIYQKEEIENLLSKLQSRFKGSTMPVIDKQIPISENQIESTSEVKKTKNETPIQTKLWE